MVELYATGGNPAEPFGTIGGMVEATAGTIVISDDVNKALYRWEPGSGRIARLARDGRGPGEMQAPVSLARRPDGGFVVYDVGHNALLLFRTDLTHERTARVQGGMVSNPKSIAILGDGSFVISGGRLRDPRHLHHYSPTGQWIESSGEPAAGITSSMARIQSAGGALRALPQGFLFSYGAPLRISRFPSNILARSSVLVEDGQILPEFTEASLNGSPEPRSGGSPVFLWWHDRTTGVFVLPDGRILNVITRYHSGDSVWDLYSSDGRRRLARTIVPRAYYAWDITTDGRIVASRRDPDTDEHFATVLELRIR